MYTMASQSAMMAKVVPLIFGTASATVTCPGSPAWVHAGMEITATASASCQDVQDEMIARVNGQYAQWHDPHNNGTYTLTGHTLRGDLSFSRVTGNKKYTDKMQFKLTQVGDSQCTIEGCSESQVLSWLDYGTNYCDLKMLYCGSSDGCKYVKYNFGTTNEVTKPMGGSTVDPSACLKVMDVVHEMV